MSDDISGIIYMYTSPSGKSYIGQTTNEKLRKKSHGSLRSKCTAFNNAIAKYGYCSFKYTILHSDIKTREELDRLEEYEIISRNTLSPDGYNLRHGGNVKTLTDEVRAKISIGNLGKTMSEESRVKMQNGKGVKVRCIETGQVYDSIAKASRHTGINDSCLYGTCKGRHNTAGGFHWIYESDIENIDKVDMRYRARKVKCITLDIIYKNAEEAAAEFEISSYSIRRCCSGGTKTYYGMKWEYVY